MKEKVEEVEERSTVEESFQQRFLELTPEPFLEQKLIQYGYLLFRHPSSDFESMRHLPIGPDYVLGPGDTLILRIFGNFFAEYELKIDRDGKINVPEVGPLELRGFTFREARSVIEEHIKSYYSGIRVTVTMGDLRSIFVHIIGEVKRPGIHELDSLSTVIQALFSSQGPNRYGSMRDIRILRDNEIISRFDLYDFLLEGDLKKDLRLQDNDVVFVPTIRGLVAIGGEIKRPGIYEHSQDMRLSDLLELAGGLTSTAFLKNIKVERVLDNEEMILLVIKVDDLETFAGSEDDIYLKDSDLIFIDTITTHRMPKRQAFVTISGNIARPGDFHFSPGMTVSDLIQEAGGVLPETLFERGEIWRFLSSNTRQVIPFAVQEALDGKEGQNLPLQEWDQVRIYAHYDVVPEKMVGIKGEIHKPLFIELLEEEEQPVEDEQEEEGHPQQQQPIDDEEEEEGPYWFSFVEGMTLRDLLFRGHEPTEDAYLQRAELFRHRKDALREVISVDLRQVLSGEYDLQLKAGDLLYVYSMDWVFPVQTVEIFGAVEAPGEYERYQDMHVSDLIFQAGGLKREAYLDAVEIYRPGYGEPDGPLLITTSIRGIKEAIYGIETFPGDIPLQEGDRVFIRTHIEEKEVRTITLVGEVNLPGEYILQPDERLTSVIERAGGLTSMAYPFGAVMTREMNKKQQQEFLMDFVSYQRQSILEERARIGQLPLTTQEREEQKQILDYQEQALELMRARMPKGRILFDLETALADDNSLHNMKLHHQDHLFIPPQPQVVMVMGEVFNPESILFEPGRDLNDYLFQVGGITPRGDAEQIYILKANGRVETNFTGFGPLDEGDMIVVPAKTP